MRLKIGVMGGTTGVMSREVLEKAHALGRAIARSGCILVTGGRPGLPLASACGAKEERGFVVGSESVGKRARILISGEGD
jgi:predicted Rossmann-fold nucleotide-binding protein